MTQVNEGATDSQIEPLGHHVILELEGCTPDLLKGRAYVELACSDAAKAAGCKVVGDLYHQFDPYGVSGATVLEESHLTIHTWPERGYAAVDLFYCGSQVDPAAARSLLEERFEAKHTRQIDIPRGPLQEDPS
jgi:S-adenosylmethionine decarboxylase proenzyme